jgi:hypothetical protein
VSITVLPETGRGSSGMRWIISQHVELILKCFIFKLACHMQRAGQICEQ